jgi:hypothetical protein
MKATEGEANTTQYKPTEMPAAILSISGGGGGGITPSGELEITENGSYDVTTYASALVNVASSGGMEIEPIVLTGSQSYGCAGALAAKTIELFPDKISTNQIAPATYLFYGSTLEEIPFAIDLYDPYGAGNCVDCSSMFNKARLTKLPVITGKIGACTNLFASCEYLTDISEMVNWDFDISSNTSSYSRSNMFQGCKRLRHIPAEAIAHTQARIQYSYQSSNAFMTRLVSDCSSLETIHGIIPDDISGVGVTGNIFSYAFDSAWRLSEVTFATQADGSPLVRNDYNKVVLDFTSNCGWAGAWNAYAVMPELGFTDDNKVTSAATYESLKNNPDWWADVAEYSRFNHDSAVKVINTLPDTSSASGATVKFKGIAGSGYGKAINDLTEAEIAVAAARGWTVSIL